MNDNINWLLEIFKMIIPVILSCMATLIITNYSFRKNRPLENYKIAYDRVYYPIYRIIKDTNTCMEVKIEKIDNYINKYEKYIDRSTIKSFKYLKKIPDKTSYQNFCNNIDKLCSILRINLGYLEPSNFRMYKYSPTGDKRFFRMIMEVLFLFYAVIFPETFEIQIVSTICYYIMIFIIVIIIIELMFILWNVFLKIIEYIHYKIVNKM